MEIGECLGDREKGQLGAGEDQKKVTPQRPGEQHCVKARFVNSFTHLFTFQFIQQILSVRSVGTVLSGRTVNKAR